MIPPPPHQKKGSLNAIYIYIDYFLWLIFLLVILKVQRWMIRIPVIFEQLSAEIMVKLLLLFLILVLIINKYIFLTNFFFAHVRHACWIQTPLCRHRRSTLLTTVKGVNGSCLVNSADIVNYKGAPARTVSLEFRPLLFTQRTGLRPFVLTPAGLFQIMTAEMWWLWIKKTEKKPNKQNMITDSSFVLA